MVLDGKDVTRTPATASGPPRTPPHVPARPAVRMAHGGGQRPRRPRMAQRRRRVPRRSRGVPDAPVVASGTVAGGSTTCSSGAGWSRCARSWRAPSPSASARMVELARAIVDGRRLLLLDEPASGLDETETVRLGEQIQAVRDDTGCVVLLVEHNAGFVMQPSDRVVVLNLGTVLADGTPEEVQRNQAPHRGWTHSVRGWRSVRGCRSSRRSGQCSPRGPTTRFVTRGSTAATRRSTSVSGRATASRRRPHARVVGALGASRAAPRPHRSDHGRTRRRDARARTGDTGCSPTPSTSRARWRPTRSIG